MVMEFVADDGRKAFGVVDSNCKAGAKPPALLKLEALGATDLNFVVLTHPHADHFRGLEAILHAYAGRIANFYSFPIERDGRLKAWLTEYANAVSGSEHNETIQAAKELIRIFVWADKDVPNWETFSGHGQRMYVPNMPGLSLSSVLPPSAVKGQFYNDISSGKSIYRAERDNQLSLALLVEYGGKSIVLGGDGTWQNWQFTRNRHTPRPTNGSHGTLNASVAKIPHHGSEHDAREDVIRYIFGDETSDEKRIAVISADGRSHPSPEVIKDLHRSSISPYCTNLASLCSSGPIKDMISSHSLDEVLLRNLNALATDTVRIQPCQGDVTVEVTANGGINVTRQYQNLCPFRDDFPLDLALVSI